MTISVVVTTASQAALAVLDSDDGEAPHERIIAPNSHEAFAVYGDHKITVVEIEADEQSERAEQ